MSLRGCSHPWQSKALRLFCLVYSVFYAVALFRRFRVVEAFESTHQIAGNAAYAFKAEIAFAFLSAAFGAGVAYHAGVAAVGVAVYGVIYRAVAYVRSEERRVGKECRL